MLDHSEILRLHDESWISSQNTRERAADDLLFARVTQWGDPYLETDLEYRGQFDQIRKARRKNLSEMRANPVQVSYLPGMGGNEETAELLEKRYRFDMSTPGAKQATIIAQQDQVDCGYGAWRIVTDYENSALNEQIIKREPIHEANNRVFRDPNGAMPDGSDDEWCSVIWSITKEGWPNFARHIGADPDDTPSSWRPPEDGYVFPWITENFVYNIGEFYHRERVMRTGYVFENLRTGDVRMVDEDDADSVVDDLMRQGFMYASDVEYETYEVTRYWCSGGGYLVEPEIIPGSEIPIVHLYGEISKVENSWVWEGIVRLAKDPQMLRNFMLSYLAGIAGKGSRQRPYFGLSQIEGLEWQFEEGGPDQNLAYRVLNDVDDDGNPIQAAPISYEKTPDIPEALSKMVDAASGAIEDTTHAGVPQDVADSNLSGKAVTALQNQVDMQTYTYIDNYSLALQREAEIYASKVPSTYDTVRELGLLSEDGSESTQTVNTQVIDWETGNVVTTYDMTGGNYKVRTKVAPAFQSRMAQKRAEKIELYAASQADPEMQRVLLLEIMSLDESSGDSVSTTYARRQLLQMGLVEAETDEDREYLATLQQASQSEEPDPLMVAALAEQKKAETDQMEAQIKAMGAETDRINAQTDRYRAMIDAQKAGMEISIKEVERTGRELDNMGKARDLRAPVSQSM